MEKGIEKGAAAYVSTIGLPINIDLSFADSEEGGRDSPPRALCRQKERAKGAKGEKGANSCAGKILSANQFQTVKPINLWIHVSKLCVSFAFRDILQVSSLFIPFSTRYLHVKFKVQKIASSRSILKNVLHVLFKIGKKRKLSELSEIETCFYLM